MQLTVCRYAKLLSCFSAKLLFSCALNYCVLEFHVSVVLESFTGILYFVCVLIAEYLWHGSVITKDSHFFLLLRYCRTERGTDREVCSRYHSHSLSPWSRVLPEKLKRPELLNKFPAFYGTRRFITAFTRARYLSLSWATLIQSMPPIQPLAGPF
jgi:hypothetical protein